MTATHLKTITVYATCDVCLTGTPVKATHQQWDAWCGGALAQNCFPHLSEDVLELIITGTCGECFDKQGCPPGCECGAW